MEPYCFTTDFHASVRRLSISGCSWKPDCSGSKTGAPTPIVCCTTTTGSPPPSATSVADAIFGRDSACGGYWISSGPPKYSCWTSMSARARRGVVMEFSSADRAQPSPVDDCPSIIAWEDPGACQMVCVSRTERNGTIMTMTNEKQQHDDGPSGQDLVEQLKASGQLDALFEQI